MSGWRGVIWYGGRAGVAVLYSVVVDSVREFWVKTRSTDRKIAVSTDQTVPIALRFTAGVNTGAGGSASTSGSASVTVTFTATGSTVVTPSSLSFLLTASASGTGGIDVVEANGSVRISGSDAVTIDVDYTLAMSSVNSTNADDDPNGGAAGNRVSLDAVVGFSGVLGGSERGFIVQVAKTGGESSATDVGDPVVGSSSDVLSRFFSTTQGLLNAENAFIRRSVSFRGAPSDGLSLDGRFIFFIPGFGGARFRGTYSLAVPPIAGIGFRYVQQILDSSAVVLISSVTPFHTYSFQITSIAVSGTGIVGDPYLVVLDIIPLATSDTATNPFMPSANSLAYFGVLEGGDIVYGLYGVGSELLPVYTDGGDPILVYSGDWRAPIVSFAPDLSSVGPCLQSFIYDNQANFSGKLYTIDLVQDIGGDTLQTLLQTTEGNITATLSTRTATDVEDSCDLGTVTTSTVQVPSPGRGTIEGITYLP